MADRERVTGSLDDLYVGTCDVRAETLGHDGVEMGRVGREMSADVAVEERECTLDELASLVHVEHR